jgi:hypothetical protein
MMARTLNTPLSAALAAALACVAMGAQAFSIPDPIGFTVDPTKAAQDIAKGPTLVPESNKTSFDPALRCMDRLFGTYGIHGVPMMIEELPDATRKVNVGAREMFMSATSRMTQRSRAIKLIPYQRDSIVFSERKDFVEAAQYVLQGSVTQLDESVLKRQRDGGICLGHLCIGVAESDSYSALGLDMNVIRTVDLTMVPGVSSKNSVLVVKHGTGADAELNLAKFGLNFNFTLARSEGQGQALRALIELGSVELYGRMLRIPYWTCLGNDGKQPDVAAEIDDWWESLAADVPSLVSWLQTQMRARGLYKGEVNGQANDALLKAVQAYQQALGLPANGVIDATFFHAYLAADHAKIEGNAQAVLASAQPSTRPAKAAPAKVAATPPTAAQPASALLVQDHRGPRASYPRGERYEVDVTVPRNGFLYCFLIDENQQFNQFFPNAVQSQAAVSEGDVLQFPGPYPFTLLASRRGKTETVACGLSDTDLGPSPIAAGKASKGQVDDLLNRLTAAAGQAIGFGAFHVNAK